MQISLRFPIADIPNLVADHAEYEDIRERHLMELKPEILHRGYFNKAELEKVARWKAPRSSRHVNKNDNDYVIEVSRFAFAAKSERARIESLTLLDGVRWPMASAILHLFHHDLYPILDFRALWSVSLDVPNPYNFDFWWSYVKYCRKMATTACVDMRTLDKALWTYSKKNQNR